MIKYIPIKMSEEAKKAFEEMFNRPLILTTMNCKTKENSFYKLDSLDFSRVEPITEEEATKLYSE